MDDKPERPAAGEPDLAAALRRARVENAERAEAVAELREIELGRLALLESALQPVVRQAPPGVDLFDLTLAKGDRPRVFLDMVAFIEMARDRRTYRFFQDTLYGRVLIAESPKIDTIVAACTNYVARRLVERERALAAEGLAGEDGRVNSTAFTSRRPRDGTSGAGEVANRRDETDGDDQEAPLHAPLGGFARPKVIRAGERMPEEAGRQGGARLTESFRSGDRHSAHGGRRHDPIGSARARGAISSGRTGSANSGREL